MIKNLTKQQILLIIIFLIILIILIFWIMSRNSIQPFQQIDQPTQLNQPNQQKQSILPEPKLTSDNAQLNQTDKPFTLFYFYRPDCNSCKMFRPVWNELLDKIKNISNLSPEAINTSDSQNDNLAFYYNISHVPTLILVTPNSHIEYTGNRTPDDIYKFILSHMTS